MRILDLLASWWEHYCAKESARTAACVGLGVDWTSCYARGGGDSQRQRLEHLITVQRGRRHGVGSGTGAPPHNGHNDDTTEPREAALVTFVRPFCLFALLV